MYVDHVLAPLISSTYVCRFSAYGLEVVADITALLERLFDLTQRPWHELLLDVRARLRVRRPEGRIHASPPYPYAAGCIYSISGELQPIPAHCYSSFWAIPTFNCNATHRFAVNVLEQG